MRAVALATKQFNDVKHDNVPRIATKLNETHKDANCTVVKLFFCTYLQTPWSCLYITRAEFDRTGD